MAARPPHVFTPGPTALHPAVADAMADAARDGFLSESHRSARFRMEVARAVEAFRTLLAVPGDHRVLFTGSATEAMERIVEGSVRRRSFHLVNGAFARRFRTVASNLGREATSIEVPDGESFDSAVALPSGVELLAITQNETSTGARVPPDVVHALAERARGGGALVAVDLVTGWPTEAVDPARIDAGFLSVQKAFGLPAGLGVITASPALLEKARRLQAEGRSIGGYLHLVAMAEAADRHETVATPNMLAIRLLRCVSEAYLERGIRILRDEAEEKAGRFWAALQGSPLLVPAVSDSEVRSRTILVAHCSCDAEALRGVLRERGFLVGGGYGPTKGRHLRVANFPVQTPSMVEALARELVAVASERERERAGKSEEGP